MTLFFYIDLTFHFESCIFSFKLLFDICHFIILGIMLFTIDIYNNNYYYTIVITIQNNIAG